MKFELSVIENALKYYKINDTDYKDKCYKCIKDVNEIKVFNIKSKEIYNILYHQPAVFPIFFVIFHPDFSDHPPSPASSGLRGRLYRP